MPLARKILITGTGLTGALLAITQLHKLKSHNKHLRESLKTNSEEKLLTIDGPNVLSFPWERRPEDLSAPEDWEFRKITIKGILGNNTHLVYREREGKPGYLVFKPLITATMRNNPLAKSKVPEALDPQTGIMVNLGWLPFEKGKDVKNIKVTYVKKYEPGTNNEEGEAEELPSIFPQIRNPYTSIVYKGEGVDELDEKEVIEGWDDEEVVITGFLRKGEEEDRLIGRRNWRKEYVNCVIDLERMSAFYGFINHSSAREYYLETAVEKNLAKVKKNNDLIPSSFENSEAILKEYEEDKISGKYKKLRNISGILALVGFFV